MDTQFFSLRTNMKLIRFACDTAICMCGTPKYDSVQITQALFFIVLLGQGCIF